MALTGVDLVPGHLSRGPGACVLLGACRRLRAASIAALPGPSLPQGLEPGLEASDVFEPPEITYPYGMDAALVEVDPETGQVRVLKYAIACDVGRALNPPIVEGHIIGGLVQGVGAALYEELAYDEAGQLLTTTLMDYLLPTAMETPGTVVVRVGEDAPSPSNPLGAGPSRGAGAAGGRPRRRVVTIPVRRAAPSAVEMP